MVQSQVTTTSKPIAGMILQVNLGKKNVEIASVTLFELDHIHIYIYVYIYVYIYIFMGGS